MGNSVTVGAHPGTAAQSGNKPGASLCRRSLRTCAFALLVLGAYLFGLLFNFRYVRKVPTWRKYDSASLIVVVKSCDVTVEAGDANEITVEGILPDLAEEITFGDMDEVKIISVNNVGGCSYVPKHQCSKVCHVRVNVQNGAAPQMLHIYQDRRDTAGRVLVDVKGVTLKNFLVRGQGGNWWDTAGPTIDLEVRDSIVEGAFKTFLNSGQVYVRSSDLRGKVELLGINSVSVIDIPDNKRLSVNWRQPNSQVCMVPGAGQLSLPDPRGPFAMCESWWYKDNFVKFYDSNSDRFIDEREFQEGLKKLPYCCGGSCPHASYCDGIVYNIFPFTQSSDAGFTGRAGILTAPAAWENVKKLGYAGFAPYCVQKVSFTTPLTNPRTIEGWPKRSASPSSAPVTPTLEVYCLRHSDCFTGYCDQATSRCDKNPNVTYAFQYEWGSCDKACGGGERIRSSTCIASDGHEYPDSLCTDLTGFQAPMVGRCNEQACVVPSAAPATFTISADEDLRADWLSVQATVSVPAGATQIRVMLGTNDTALDTPVTEVDVEDCGESATVCQFTVAAELPSYVDRLYAAGATADGHGPTSQVVFVDRVGAQTQGTWKLVSEAGMVRLSLKQDGTAAAPKSWEPPGKLDGIRMYGDDAKKLMKEVGPTLGDPSSTRHGIVVIDVAGAPGIPASRWFYSTRPVYLSLDVAHLQFLTGGLLTPDILYYRIRMNDLTCTHDNTDWDHYNLEDSATQARFSEMYRQIEKAMRSDGWAYSTRLRGLLVVLGPKHSLSPSSSDIWKFDLSDDNVNITMTKHTGLDTDTTMDVAVSLSMAVGALLSVVAVYASYHFAQRILKEFRQDKISRKRTLAAKLGDKAEDILEEEDGLDAFTQGNPFRQPLVLISILTVEPLRRRILDSLWKFVNEKVEVEPAFVAEQPPDTTSPTSDKKVAPADVESPGSVTGSRPIKPEVINVAPGPPKDEPKKLTKVTPTSSAPSFTYMRQFRKEYEIYCIDQGLNPVTCRNQIVHKLVEWYDIRTVQDTVWRLKGVQWVRGSRAASKTRVPSKTEVVSVGGSAPPSTSTAGPLDAVTAFRRFMESEIKVTGGYGSHFIDVRTRRRPDGRVVRGLYEKYIDWCERNDAEAFVLRDLDPLDPESPLQAYAQEMNVPYQEVTVQRIPRMKMRDKPVLSIHWRVFVADFMQVVMACIVLILPAVVLFVHAVRAQEVYAMTMAVDDALTWLDIAGTVAPYFGYGVTDKQVMLICRVLTITQTAYIILAIVRIHLHFLGINLPWANWIFAGVLFLEMSGFLAWIGTFGAWCVLAAILEPTKFLAYGAAVLVFVGVTVAIWKEMHAVMETVRGKIDTVVKNRMQQLLRTVEKQVQAQMHERATTHLKLRQRIGAKPPSLQVDDTQQGFDEYRSTLSRQRPVTITDIFEMLDTDHSGTLSDTEFRRLFAPLSDKMSEDELDQFFAYADTDGSGKVTSQELEDAWAWIAQKIVNKELANMGITLFDVVLMVVLGLAILLMLFAFIFSAIEGWYNESSFEAIVQTALVAGSGKVVTALRRRAPAETQDISALMSDGGDGEGEGDGGDGDGGGDGGG